MRTFQDGAIKPSRKTSLNIPDKNTYPMADQCNKGSSFFRPPFSLSLVASFCHGCLGLCWVIASHSRTAAFSRQYFSCRKIPVDGYQIPSHLFSSTGIDKERWYCGEMGKFLFSPRAERSFAQQKNSPRGAAGSWLRWIQRWDGASHQHAWE